MRKRFLLSLSCTILSLSIWGIDLSQVRFHNEASDTTRLNNLLSDINAMHLSDPGERVLSAGKAFLGTPYVPNTLEGNPELLTVNLDELDCTTFMETALAMAITIGERRTSWRDYIYNLERIRYRNGKINGYPSRLHYFSDWAVDNMHKGFVKDVTPAFNKCSYVIKTIDFMSSNADKYEALSDSINLAGIKTVEMGFRGYRSPYIKTVDVASKSIADGFKNGDIVAFILKDKSLDVGHVGIIIIEDGVPYLLHASSGEGKVTISKNTLADYLKRHRNYMGVRVLRIEE